MIQDRGIFSDPLEGWGNEDLLFSEKARELARADDAEVFELLDWPELRTEFEKHEASAKRSKSTNRTLGFVAVCMVGFGAAALPLVSLASAPALIPVTLVCVTLIVMGFLSGVVHFVVNYGTPPWLSHRLFAERLRHLYFQAALSNFDLLFGGLTKTQTSSLWYEARSKILDAAINSFDQQSKSGWRQIREDRDFQSFEVLGCALRPDTLSEAFQSCGERDPKAFGRLIHRLYLQRIHIQYEFTARNLAQTVATPPLRHQLARTLLVISTLGVPALALSVGIFLLLGNEGAAYVLLAFLGTLASIGLTARVVEEGLKFKADEERYSSYLSAIRAVKEAFMSGGNRDKALALRRLEQEAYRETRQFFVTHLDDNFLG